MNVKRKDGRKGKRKPEIQQLYGELEECGSYFYADERDHMLNGQLKAATPSLKVYLVYPK